VLDQHPFFAVRSELGNILAHWVRNSAAPLIDQEVHQRSGYNRLSEGGDVIDAALGNAGPAFICRVPECAHILTPDVDYAQYTTGKNPLLNRLSRQRH
jgi:hypothetical protein